MFRNLYMALGMGASMLFGALVAVSCVRPVGSDDLESYPRVIIQMACFGAVVGIIAWKIVTQRRNLP